MVLYGISKVELLYICYLEYTGACIFEMQIGIEEGRGVMGIGDDGLWLCEVGIHGRCVCVKRAGCASTILHSHMVVDI